MSEPPWLRQLCPFLDGIGKYSYIYGRILKEPDLTTYSVAQAKNTLHKLIDRALRGEEVIITRHGKPVAELRPAQGRSAPPRGTYEWLCARRDARPGVGLTSVEILDLLYAIEEP